MDSFISEHFEKEMLHYVASILPENAWKMC